ncbi:MAG: hypothetical protein QM742_09320 [Aquabacterium sp.]
MGALVIPGFNHSHVLPPFVGESPTSPAQQSPYEISATELTHRFGTSPARQSLLTGLFRYRQELRTLGFTDGFQWLDGSFVEDVESAFRRAPGDIDLVTFARTPEGWSRQQVEALILQRPDLFNSRLARAEYGCDGYFLRLDGAPERLVRRTAYYLSLFSHRRSDNVWKGLLHLPLQSDDELALARLTTTSVGEFHAAAA